jgi:hypothetical protein
MIASIIFVIPKADPTLRHPAAYGLLDNPHHQAAVLVVVVWLVLFVMTFWAVSPTNDRKTLHSSRPRS